MRIDFSSSLASFRKDLAKTLGDPFRPPFVGLAVIFWIYYIYAFLVFPHSSILRGDPLFLAQCESF
jgi:hypothetical protein